MIPIDLFIELKVIYWKFYLVVDIMMTSFNVRCCKEIKISFTDFSSYSCRMTDKSVSYGSCNRNVIILSVLKYIVASSVLLQKVYFREMKENKWDI